MSHVVNESDTTTRERLLNLDVQRGPIRAAELAAELQLTSAAIRRHLTALEEEGQITVRPEVPVAPRGRGRPAKRYIATTEAHTKLPEGYSRAAVMAIEQLRDPLGAGAAEESSGRRADELVRRYRKG